MAGMCPPSYSTSMTGPITWITLPTVVFAAAVAILSSLRSRHDFDNLPRNRGLADLVHVERQPLDHFLRVARGAVHRLHARRMFGGRGFEQRALHLHGHVHRQQ